VFLLVPAYPGSPGSKAVKQLCVCVCVCVCVSVSVSVCKYIYYIVHAHIARHRDGNYRFMCNKKFIVSTGCDLTEGHTPCYR